MMRRIVIGAVVGCSMLLAACGGSSSSEDPSGNIASAVGDSMASLDEMGSGGGFAYLMRPVMQAPASMKPGLGHQIAELLLPSAEAAGCFQDSFSACSDGQRTRTFDSCNVGPATLSGSVELDFSDLACGMASAGDSVTRKANFTLTGPNGGNITVSSTDGGQSLTRADSGFSYAVAGMHRIGVDASGKTRFDIQTSTSQPISVTGTSRRDRVENGGVLVVTHNLAKYTAELTPANVTWDGTCNCPVSGSWSGTLSGSRTGNYTLTITGCGTATVVDEAGQSKDVSFDRCAKL